jgi:hypothetical protein
MTILENKARKQHNTMAVLPQSIATNQPTNQNKTK